MTAMLPPMASDVAKLLGGFGSSYSVSWVNETDALARGLRAKAAAANPIVTKRPRNILVIRRAESPQHV
jgi:hypothetical protein